MSSNNKKILAASSLGTFVQIAAKSAKSLILLKNSGLTPANVSAKSAKSLFLFGMGYGHRLDLSTSSLQVILNIIIKFKNYK